MFQITLHLCRHVQTMHTSMNYWLLNGEAWTSQQLGPFAEKSGGRSYCHLTSPSLSEILIQYIELLTCKEMVIIFA